MKENSLVSTLSAATGKKRGGGGVLPGKLILKPLPYLGPDQKLNTLIKTWPLNRLSFMVLSIVTKK